MIAIGIGANSRAVRADFVIAIQSMRQLTGGADVVATIEDLNSVEELQSAASDLDVPLRLLAVAELRKQKDECVTRSEMSLARYGVLSVAEAAALAGAGPSSKLIETRRIFGNVTAAAALAPDDDNEGARER